MDTNIENEHTEIIKELMNTNPEVAKIYAKAIVDAREHQARKAAIESMDIGKPDPIVPEGYVSQFPIPYGEEQLHKDIVSLYLMPLRYLTLIGRYEDRETVMQKFFNSPNIYKHLDLMDFELKDQDTGLTFEDIKETALATQMIGLYKYAYLGIDEIGAEGEFEMDSNLELYINWLKDMAHSTFNDDWSTSNEGAAAAQRCFRTAEIANIRSVLEGCHGVWGLAEDSDGLSIREMALLSGMEEMSIRAAANPKRANPLSTYKDKDGSTTVSLKEAKRWLISKNRYVPIQIGRYEIEEIRLEDMRPESIFHFNMSLAKLYAWKRQNNDSNEQIAEELRKSNETFNRCGFIAIGQELENKVFLDQVARMLNVDAELLSLKHREAKARGLLREIELDLHEKIMKSEK